MTHFHVVIWIDHRVAQIYGLGREGMNREFVKSNGPHHIHHKAGTVGSGHERDNPSFFREIATHLAGAGAILIVGPAGTKSELKAFLDAQAPAIAAKVIGMEALEAESEGEIIAFAHKFFVLTDRMTPQR